MDGKTIASFGFVVRKNGDKIEVGFKQAKRVPKAYANFVASLEIMCLNMVNKLIRKVDEDGEKSSDK